MDSSISTTAAIAPQGSKLLNMLPAEIRNEIWRLVLVAPTDDNETSIPIGITLTYRTALLKTCRQTRAEGSSILYAENKFSAKFALGCKNPLLLWLSAIGPENARQITKLTVEFVRSERTAVLIDRIYNGDPEKQIPGVMLHTMVDQPARELAKSVLATGIRPECVVGEGDEEYPAMDAAFDFEKLMIVAKMCRYFVWELDFGMPSMSTEGEGSEGGGSCFDEAEALGVEDLDSEGSDANGSVADEGIGHHEAVDNEDDF